MYYYTIIFKDKSKEIFPFPLTEKEAIDYQKKNNIKMKKNIHFGCFSNF